MRVVASYSFFFNDTATTEIYTLSLHDALPISWSSRRTTHPCVSSVRAPLSCCSCCGTAALVQIGRAHVELQSPYDLVCRLLLEKKKTASRTTTPSQMKITRSGLR